MASLVREHGRHSARRCRQEEEEPSVMTRLCLTGRAMVALLDALNQPEETEEGMRLVLSRSDYGELMRQIRLEAD